MRSKHATWTSKEIQILKLRSQTNKNLKTISKEVKCSVAKVSTLLKYFREKWSIPSLDCVIEYSDPSTLAKIESTLKDLHNAANSIIALTYGELKFQLIIRIP